jgi:hypothetical protein
MIVPAKLEVTRFQTAVLVVSTVALGVPRVRHMLLLMTRLTQPMIVPETL